MPSPMRNAALGALCLAAAAASPPGPRRPSLATPGPVRFRPRPPALLAATGTPRGGGADDAAGDPPSGVRRKRRGGKSRKKSRAAEPRGGGGDAGDDNAQEREDDADADGAARNVAEGAEEAAAPGDGGRDRLPYPERTFDAALVSLGLSMGTAGTDGDGSNSGVIDALAYYQYGHRDSIHASNISGKRGEPDRERVPSSTSAVVADYFLKTHGGTHVAQCLLSLLASILGAACLALPAFPSRASAAGATAAAATASKAAADANSLSRRILLSCVKCQLMQQALLVAAARHAAGLLGAASLGASRIPRMGVRNARQYLESVALDPAGQYLFYCSLLAAWMGWFGGGAGGVGMREYVARLRGSVVSVMNASAAATVSSDDAAQDAAATVAQLLDTLSQQPPPWFLSQSTGGLVAPVLILGPVLLREITSVLWVCSDVLTLAAKSSDDTFMGKFCLWTLSGCRSVLDALMTAFISSDQWRRADSSRRQRALARLVSRCSLAAELAVGAMLMGDAMQSFWAFAFVGPAGGGGVGRLPFKCALGKAVCANLYLNFLLSRRKRIAPAIGSVRGGGAAEDEDESKVR